MSFDFVEQRAWSRTPGARRRKRSAHATCRLHLVCQRGSLHSCCGFVGSYTPNRLATLYTLEVSPSHDASAIWTKKRLPPSSRSFSVLASVGLHARGCFVAEAQHMLNRVTDARLLHRKNNCIRISSFCCDSLVHGILHEI